MSHCVRCAAFPLGQGQFALGQIRQTNVLIAACPTPSRIPGGNANLNGLSLTENLRGQTMELFHRALICSFFTIGFALAAYAQDSQVGQITPNAATASPGRSEEHTSNSSH